MKNRITFLLFLTTALMLSCSDDKPSGPDQPNDALLTSATIGSAGGELIHEGFELTVPAGAFASSASLDLYESGEDAGYGENVISPLYRIDGLPETFAESLHVRIMCTGTPTEECFVFFGDINDDSDVNLIPASDTLGTMYVTIPPRTAADVSNAEDLGKVSAPSEKTDYFAAIANFKSTYTTSLYRITYPAYLLGYIDDLAAYIEEAKAAVEGVGMSYNHEIWTWPGEIIVKPVKNLTAGSTVRLWLYEDKPPKALLDEGALATSTLPSVRVGIHRMMMATAQCAYDIDKYYYPRNFWWHEAVRQWFPAVIPGSTAPAVPQRFGGHEYEPFKGLIAGSDYNTDREHGYGSASFVRYLETKFGKSVIGDIYVQIVRGNELYDALLYGAGEDVYNWLPEYFDKLLRGELYNASAEAMVANATGSYTIASDADTLVTFFRGCPQLGAQIYRFNLDYDNISADAVLNLTLEGDGINQDYVTLLVYKYKNGAIAYVGAGNDLKVSGLRDLTQAGYDILAVAVNSYSEGLHTGTTAITLTATIQTPRVFNFNHAEILITDITYDCYEEWEDETRTFENHHGASWEVNGAFTENTFNGVKTWGSGDYVCSLFVSITIDPVSLDITAFDASERCGSPTYKQSRSIRSVPGNPVPFVGSEHYMFWYAHSSSDVCGYFNYEGTIQGFPPQYTHWYSICNSSTCLDGDPLISIEVNNE